MNKSIIIEKIVAALADDLLLFANAAKTSHLAATHEECIPDNKYDTTALEASYLAQGQANRAQEIRTAMESYRTLALQSFDANRPIRLTALVTLEAEGGAIRRFFLGAHAGGMKISDSEEVIVVITPESPLGRSLLGLKVGDDVQLGGNSSELFSIVDVC